MPGQRSINSFGARRMLKVKDREFVIYDVRALSKHGIDVDRLPITLRILLENLLRHEDGENVTKDDITAFAGWLKTGTSERDIPFSPARVLLQDFTGVPAVVDLAAMRDCVVKMGGDPQKINPLSPVDLVIDHSVMVDAYGSPNAFAVNVKKEFERNHERYSLLRWAQQSFRNFRVVPPGTGICHQVNLEYLSKVVWIDESDPKAPVAFPDTLFGTDSHTTMVNGIGVLGWGVGGIEAEASMLGLPSAMLIPPVVGMRMKGKARAGITATDVVLTVTQTLRKHGVVNKFVEFYGEGLDSFALADRATIGNMAPEYGATCGFFPVDQEALAYLKLSGRSEDLIALVETYTKETGLWRESGKNIRYTETIDFDLSTVEPCVAGPKRPQDRVPLSQVPAVFNANFQVAGQRRGSLADERAKHGVDVVGENYHLCHGDVVLAAITSCTNTSNPSVMIAAGLLARNARKLGLKSKPWVKTSLAPGSQVVSDYLTESLLQSDLDALGFHVVGYGCTTCIGNSGPLPNHIADAITKNNLSVAAVLSGNRNFEARINPHVRANFLASPPLVVAYAIAGTVDIDIANDIIAHDSHGKGVRLSDIWPDHEEIAHYVKKYVNGGLFKKRYADVFAGQDEWRALKVDKNPTFAWENHSTYVRRPPFFDGMTKDAKMQNIQTGNIKGARLLALLGDSITTDHISPAGSFRAETPAGKYLVDHGIQFVDFNSYGARRGNHEVMIRGTLANSRIRNLMLQDKEGGWTKHFPSGEVMSIYDAAVRYQSEKIPLIVIGGKEYGTGSSRDWAAKGTLLLGVRAVIAQSFERIHRANLVGMGVLPLELPVGVQPADLALTGGETFDLLGLEGKFQPRAKVKLVIHSDKGEKDRTIELLCRIDTLQEISYYNHGGILPYVLEKVMSRDSSSKAARS